MEKEKIMITVYTKPGCVQCDATIRLLGSQGIPYRCVNLREDEEALDYVRGLGNLQAPVVITKNDHWSGFRPDKILLAQVDTEASAPV